MLKTFKGRNIKNIQNIDEGILSSTKTGAKNIAEEFLNKYFHWAFRYDNIKLESPTTISTTNIDLSFKDVPSDIVIPVSVTTCNNLEYNSNSNKTIILPKVANVVNITNCKYLEKIIVNGESKINELYIDGCEKLDFLNINELKNLECERLTIKGCNITTIKAFKNITKKLTISGCKKLKMFDLECKNPINIRLNSCRIKNFGDINCNKLDISLIRKSNNLSLNILNLSELYINDCDFETIELKGNTANIVVIEECENLKTLSTVDCKKSLSLVDLPEIEEYNFPTRFSGIIVLDNVKTQPIVNCKKLINR